VSLTHARRTHVYTHDFHYCSWPSRIQHIFRATKTHARNLGFYVGLYKLLMLVQKKANGKQRHYDSLVAGAVAGYVMFGQERTAVSEQVRLSFARLLYGRPDTLGLWPSDCAVRHGADCGSGFATLA